MSHMMIESIWMSNVQWTVLKPVLFAGLDTTLQLSNTAMNFFVDIGGLKIFVFEWVLHVMSNLNVNISSFIVYTYSVRVKR